MNSISYYNDDNHINKNSEHFVILLKIDVSVSK